MEYIFLLITLVGFGLAGGRRLWKEARTYSNFLADQRQAAIEVALETSELVVDYVSSEKAEFIKDEKYLLSRCTEGQFQQLKKTGRPVKLGYFTKEGWSGGLPFYLFTCPYCKTTRVDYKHGHNPYLFCKDCGGSITFSHFAYLSKLASLRHSA